MNLSDDPRTLNKVAPIRDAYPITSLQQAQEMLQLYHQSSDWGSDSDDEELLDVRTAAILGAGRAGKSPSHNNLMDMSINPTDLPEHLQPLMEGWGEEEWAKKNQNKQTS